ncbi:hypothetical protein K2173_005548 [Erythroxylum novogranatense]|uniref:Acyl carrier protein n=1 Tax=Erythroxylum novogranatense TaxID=1862640 RepID=A0AAV8SKX5_9ROSI|nr:hypothetical protein K2173_005548 [Erythroxylum novogranatense]
MASVSATCLRFQALPSRLSRTSQVAQKAGLSLASVTWGKYMFPSLKSSRFHVSCMAKPEIVDKVCEIVRKQLALPSETELTPASQFSALGADSLDTVEIVMGLEETFDISVEEENSQNISTIQEAAELIDKLVQKKAEA